MAENSSDCFRRLVRIMERLQEPDGCPWDREQTHETLKPYLLEESYEALDAVDRKDMADLEEELGDVLLQVIFHAVLAARTNGEFNIDGVIETAAAKMVHRHPHVFGETEAHTADDVLKHWEQLKAVERARKGSDNDDEAKKSILAGVPAVLPALLKAQRMQEKASRVGFDWEKPHDVLMKVREELDELEQAMDAADYVHSREEFGDVLFSLVNLARFLKIDSEEALRQTSEKFRRRFMHIERRARELGKELTQMSLDEMDGYWNEAKSH